MPTAVERIYKTRNWIKDFLRKIFFYGGFKSTSNKYVKYVQVCTFRRIDLIELLLHLLVVIIHYSENRFNLFGNTESDGFGLKNHALIWQKES